MSVWFTIPSARPADQARACIASWRSFGYKTAIFRDNPDPPECPIDADITIIGPYGGYAEASNRVIREVRDRDPHATWFVCGGDDVFPEAAKTADIIAAECSAHFRGTFGVMQPTGDRWGDNNPGPWPKGSAYIDRVCGSPWLGREFCERMYGGKGPWCELYRHMFVDEELQNVAVRVGVLWQRRDLTHFHNNWGLEGDTAKMPEFLREVNSPKHWQDSKMLFESRRRAGFPGHEAIL